jgi:prephenate dehydrogenase
MPGETVWKRVVIVGVGLLGGSIGLALRQRRLAEQVIGVGRVGHAPRAAVECGAVDAALDRLEVAACEAELVICCAPVQQIPELVEACAAVMPPGGLITDVGSTKATLVEQIESGPAQSHFCGSHPMAGGTASGVQHARADLLVGKLVVVTPSVATPPGLVERTEQLWQALGARTCRLSPAEHDAAVACTSHLPHIVAAALAGATPLELLPLTASGWRDTTRVAGGNAHLWRQILEENRLPALRALENFAKVLNQWQSALERGDGHALEQLLDAGKAIRDSLGS